MAKPALVESATHRRRDRRDAPNPETLRNATPRLNKWLIDRRNAGDARGSDREKTSEVRNRGGDRQICRRGPPRDRRLAGRAGRDAPSPDFPSQPRAARCLGAARGTMVGSHQEGPGMRSKSLIFTVGGLAAAAIAAALAYWLLVCSRAARRRLRSPPRRPRRRPPRARPPQHGQPTPSAATPTAAAAPSPASTPAFDIVRVEPRRHGRRRARDRRRAGRTH